MLIRLLPNRKSATVPEPCTCRSSISCSANLKAWLNGVHHGVSPQHLQAYLNEFTFRFNRRFFPFNAFRSLLGIGAATKPTTYDALYGRRTKPTRRKTPVGN